MLNTRQNSFNVHRGEDLVGNFHVSSFRGREFLNIKIRYVMSITLRLDAMLVRAGFQLGTLVA